MIGLYSFILFCIWLFMLAFFLVIFSINKNEDEMHKDLIGDAAEAIDVLGEDALEEDAEIKRLIAMLVNDFKNENPRHTRAEALEVFTRLQGFSLSDLRMLCENLKKN